MGKLFTPSKISLALGKYNEGKKELFEEMKNEVRGIPLTSDILDKIKGCTHFFLKFNNTILSTTTLDLNTQVKDGKFYMFKSTYSNWDLLSEYLYGKLELSFFNNDILVHSDMDGIKNWNGSYKDSITREYIFRTWEDEVLYLLYSHGALGKR